MTPVLHRPVLRCRGCGHDQFMITLGSIHRPVATCQGCGQSYELWDRSAVPVRLIHADGRPSELPIQEVAS